MTKPQNYKFHSTGQFRNACTYILNKASFDGIDEDGNVKRKPNFVPPVVSYTGTVKLHGTNASIVLHEDGTISFHSKTNLLGYVKDEEFTLLSDNFEFAQTMYRRLEGVRKTLMWAVNSCQSVYGEVIFPIKVSGEWCGQGIQKGVGVSFINKKSFFVFGVKCGDTDQENKRGWLPLNMIKPVCSPDHNIYNIMDFPTFNVDIDFSNPKLVQNKLIEYTEQVEAECPVAKQLGVTDCLVGEGIVWVPNDPDYCWDSGSWFKVKGEKHSSSKVKKLASVDPEKLESIEKFVEYAVTQNRLEQGLQEVGLDQKLMGVFIGWINKDVNKEEGDTLEANNLTMKDVGKRCADVARVFYLKKLEEQM